MGHRRRDVGLDELHEVEREQIFERARRDVRAEGANRVDVLDDFDA